MTAGGTGWLGAILFVGVVVAGLAIARARAPRPAISPAAVGLWLVVAVPSLVALVFPAVLGWFERDPGRLRDGQWWRIVTSAVVQDGGVAGTVANLVALALIAPAAVAVWGAARAIGLFAAGQIVFGLVTAFVFPSVGAGSSGATLALAASAAGLALVSEPSRRESLAVAALLALTLGFFLADDAHGVAVLAGTVLGAVLATVAPPESAVPRRRDGP
ncbi:rhomboid family intramembrane serine protease [Rhodococcus rhodnii]|uniref:Uncharacterized protein n=2 Tax=Rhodococcus rhodnii TaxID=38312 RepID=R7WLE0_9NOCA|nr:rhomboid family intramembrane serine protease [Rhodococcus rhodnii]EOM76123.1 hypothetical protein Rrhod_2489 [Rhodococcus rhodnii LMG 5362]TXG91779.1 rhomboid family intramembrane serine protease [Rhodococcus rhodnii]